MDIIAESHGKSTVIDVVSSDVFTIFVEVNSGVVCWVIWGVGVGTFPDMGTISTLGSVVIRKSIVVSTNCTGDLLAVGLVGGSMNIIAESHGESTVIDVVSGDVLVILVEVDGGVVCWVFWGVGVGTFPDMGTIGILGCVVVRERFVVGTDIAGDLLTFGLVGGSMDIIAESYRESTLMENMMGGNMCTIVVEINGRVLPWIFRRVCVGFLPDMSSRSSVSGMSFGKRLLVCTNITGDAFSVRRVGLSFYTIAECNRKRSKGKVSVKVDISKLELSIIIIWRSCGKCNE